MQQSLERSIARKQQRRGDLDVQLQAFRYAREGGSPLSVCSYMSTEEDKKQAPRRRGASSLLEDTENNSLE